MTLSKRKRFKTPMKSYPYYNSFGCSLMLTIATMVGHCTALSADDQPATGSAVSVSDRGPDNARIRKILENSAEATKRVESGRIDEETLSRQRIVIENLQQLLQETGQVSATATDNEKLNGTESTPEKSDAVSEVPAADAVQSSSQSGQAPIQESGQAQSFGNLKQNQSLADAVWGHLPPRQRRDLLKSFSESYHPRYDKRVRQYFEQLARMQGEENSLDNRQPESSENEPVHSPR